MQHKRNSSLLVKILLIGGFVASLIYLFHPEAGQFSIMLNGKPVTAPLVRFAAIPALLAVLCFTGMLILLAFFGAGLLMFLSTLLLVFFGIFFIAPYAWPMLVIIILLILFISFGDNKKD
jgi:hypothetical protein